MHIGEVGSSILPLATKNYVICSMPYYVYILYSKVTDKYYIGYSENVELRQIKHKLGTTPSTRPDRSWIVGCVLFIYFINIPGFCAIKPVIKIELWNPIRE